MWFVKSSIVVPEIGGKLVTFDSKNCEYPKIEYLKNWDSTILLLLPLSTRAFFN